MAGYYALPAVSPAQPGVTTQRYIVRLKDEAFARHNVEHLQGFRKHQQMENLPLVTVDATPAEFGLLEAHHEVEYVVPDGPLQASGRI